MARRRYLSTKISLDAKVNKLAMTAGDFAALLYTWMIPHAEDDARLSGDPDELLMTVCPGRRDKSTEDIANALQAMHDLDLIVWDRDAGYVQFPDSFYSFQSYIKSRKPAQEQDSAPIDDDNSAKQRKTAQNAVSFSFRSRVRSSSSLKSSSSVEGDPRKTPHAGAATFDDAAAIAAAAHLANYNPNALQEVITRALHVMSLADIYHQIDRAHDWLNDPNANKRGKTMSFRFLDSWLERAEADARKKISQTDASPPQPLRPVVLYAE